MGNDETLLAEVREAGERAGERCWPLPLWDEYRELLKSDIADVKNSGGRGAGTIAGGWFLREFVDGFPWVHLGIGVRGTGDIEMHPGEPVHELTIARGWFVAGLDRAGPWAPCASARARCSP